MERLERLFELSKPAMIAVTKAFRSEMERGLTGKKSSLKMIPTYVKLPTGDERGKFIALDLGGTNFRVLGLTLKGGHKMSRPGIMKFALSGNMMTGRAEGFFDLIAESVKKFLKKYKLSAVSSVDLGFTFSFPIKQTSIRSGILMCWTKGFGISGVVGKDVVRLMSEAFARKGIRNVNISALVNDTVGTLVAKSYEDPACDVGVIIGTGTNACYPDKTMSGIVVNIEWGNFNKLNLTPYDRNLDEESSNPGQQILEKMVSGMYLGEITRLVLKDLAGEGLLSSEAIPLLRDKGSFGTEYMSVIEGDNSPSLNRAGKLLAELGLPGSLLKDRRIFKRSCAIVSRRAAQISASCIAAIIRKIDPSVSREHTIAIDGAVFEKHPAFSANMKRALKSILAGRSSRIRLTLAKDGSGKGAAIIAAVAAKR